MMKGDKMIFKPEHKEMILNETKTATRRVWKKPMVKVGGIYKCKLKMLSKEYFAKIKVTKLYKQKLRDMKEKDAKKEGYHSLKKFFSIWICFIFLSFSLGLKWYKAVEQLTPNIFAIL